MVITGHRRIRMVVASCAAMLTLSACAGTEDGGDTVTADEVAQQEAQEQREKPQKAGQEGDEEGDEDAAAGSTATDADLEAYVASGEKAMREMLGGTFKKIYSEIDIVPVPPNGIEYDYTFRTAVDPARATPELDKQAPTLRTQARTVVIPEMETMGFASPTVTYTYRNPDGAVMWTRTFD